MDSRLPKLPPRKHRIGVTAEQVLREAFAKSKSPTVAHPEGGKDGSSHPEGGKNGPLRPDDKSDGSALAEGDASGADLQELNPTNTFADFDSISDSDDDSKVGDCRGEGMLMVAISMVVMVAVL